MIGAEREEPPVPLVRFPSLGTVPHGISTRHGGVSPPPFHSLNLGFATKDNECHVAENRRRFGSYLGIDSQDVVSARLSHGNEVQVFSRDACASSALQQGHFSADGVVSDVPGLFVLMTVADCVPLLFADRRLGIVGAAHAGWRGTALGVGRRVVRTMVERFGSDPMDVVAAIGPSIGPCCYTVGSEVIETFERNLVEPILTRDGGTVWLDLWSTNEQQLVAEGLVADNIENPHLCTSCHVDAFFSHRAERGVTGRFGLLIGCP